VVIALAGDARAFEPSDGSAQLLFTFNALLYGASSVANPRDRAELHQFLLDYEPNEALDRAYPLRRDVASNVRLWPENLRQRALTFVLGHKTAATNYNALVLQLVGPPPAFVPLRQAIPGGQAEQTLASDAHILSGLLQEAYAAADMQALWPRYAAHWRAAQVPTERVRSIQTSVARYVQSRQHAPLEASSVMSNPLMPGGSGVTSMYADGHFVMLLGPTLSVPEAETLIAHELTHPLLNHLFKADPRARRALHNAECVFDYVRRDPDAARVTAYVYNGWESYYAESLVRAISHHLMHTPELGHGFVLTPALTWELERYETGRFSFSEFTIRSLAKLSRDYCIDSGARRVALPQGRNTRFLYQ
jgi:hypothetical protein